jgi:MFS family permease
MADPVRPLSRLRSLPRNVRAASLASFLADISSEMVLNLLPLFLANVLGVRTVVIGLIEGVAEATASLVNVQSGWLSDRLRQRKRLAVTGYAVSALAKPFFALATSWGGVAAARWGDRVGKGIRTAPRDALVAASVPEQQRGLAFGLHRAADTGGAVVGLGIALAVVALTQSGAGSLGAGTFQVLVLVSLAPAFLAVLALARGAEEVPAPRSPVRPRIRLRGLGRPFAVFLAIAALFDLGDSADAFLVLRAQERGLSVVQILAMLLCFNGVYAVLSTPAGSLSDRIGRKPVIVAGWLLYAVVYGGVALADSGAQVWLLYCLYGAYYGLVAGTAKALIAGLVREELRGTAYGTYAAVLGLLDLPASLIAGVLWEGVGSWPGFGPAAPFFFGASTAALAALLLAWLVREPDAAEHPERPSP